ncbi:hypothetical protein HK105_200598 [Polyrhizophydium stewartii]|uniref:Zinc-finger domain-containing protein n=1 Tax=Polyrhizophydium stewartii TaxID=2732419 RepID=A0ABR4NJT4_9FUNG
MCLENHRFCYSCLGRVSNKDRDRAFSGLAWECPRCNDTCGCSVCRRKSEGLGKRPGKRTSDGFPVGEAGPRARKVGRPGGPLSRQRRRHHSEHEQYERLEQHNQHDQQEQQEQHEQHSVLIRPSHRGQIYVHIPRRKVVIVHRQPETDADHRMQVDQGIGEAKSAPKKTSSARTVPARIAPPHVLAVQTQVATDHLLQTLQFTSRFASILGVDARCLAALQPLDQPPAALVPTLFEIRERIKALIAANSSSSGEAAWSSRRTNRNSMFRAEASGADPTEHANAILADIAGLIDEALCTEPVREHIQDSARDIKDPLKVFCKSMSKLRGTLDAIRPRTFTAAKQPDRLLESAAAPVIDPSAKGASAGQPRAAPAEMREEVEHTHEPPGTPSLESAGISSNASDIFVSLAAIESACQGPAGDTDADKDCSAATTLIDSFSVGAAPARADRAAGDEDAQEPVAQIDTVHADAIKNDAVLGDPSQHSNDPSEAGDDSDDKMPPLDVASSMIIDSFVHMDQITITARSEMHGIAADHAPDAAVRSDGKADGVIAEPAQLAATPVSLPLSPSTLIACGLADSHGDAKRAASSEVLGVLPALPELPLLSGPQGDTNPDEMTDDDRQTLHSDGVKSTDLPAPQLPSEHADQAVSPRQPRPCQSPDREHDDQQNGPKRRQVEIEREQLVVQPAPAQPRVSAAVLAKIADIQASMRTLKAEFIEALARVHIRSWFLGVDTHGCLYWLLPSLSGGVYGWGRMWWLSNHSSRADGGAACEDGASVDRWFFVEEASLGHFAAMLLNDLEIALASKPQETGRHVVPETGDAMRSLVANILLLSVD